MYSNTTNSSDTDSFLSVFPYITVPTSTKLKPKIIKSSKKTKKIKRIIKSTAIQTYNPSISTVEIDTPSKSFNSIVKNAKKQAKTVSSSEEISTKKLKEISKSFQFMTIFIIIFKIYSIIIKRIATISKSLGKKDFKDLWNQSMLTFTELAKYLKDLYVKSKIIKTNTNMKSFALLTDSFYKTIKIYENLIKKKKNLSDLIWKTLKFIPNLMKLLITFDYIIPLEVFFPGNYLLILAFSFKILGLLRKSYRLIRSSIKRWSLPKRRFLYFMKILILLCKLTATILGIFDLKEIVFYLIYIQVTVYMIIFLSSLRSLPSLFSRNKVKVVKETKEKNIIYEKCKVFETNKEFEEGCAKEKKGGSMILSRRNVFENGMGKEEISI